MHQLFRLSSCSATSAASPQASVTLCIYWIYLKAAAYSPKHTYIIHCSPFAALSKKHPIQDSLYKAALWSTSQMYTWLQSKSWRAWDQWVQSWSDVSWLWKHRLSCSSSRCSGRVFYWFVAVTEKADCPNAVRWYYMLRSCVEDILADLVEFSDHALLLTSNFVTTEEELISKFLWKKCEMNLK